MPLDPLAKRFISMMAAASTATPARPSTSARRQSLAKLMQFSRSDASDVTAMDGAFPGPAGDVRYRLYSPAGDENAVLPGFVFFHGGGLVAGSIETHDRVATALTETTGCRLISVDYRLAPEHKFPAAVEDAIAATEFVARNAASLRIDAGRLVVGGDSAGGTLAAVVCQHARDQGGLSITAQCLICPVLDFEEISPSREAFADDHLIGRATLEADLADYLPDGVDTADVRISPLRALSVKGLPTSIIHTAEFDPLRDEGNAYARKLLAAGVNVEHVCHDGMIHNFHAMGAVLPQAGLVISQIGEQVRRAVGA
jgi:acetyl esterase/lipase